MTRGNKYARVLTVFATLVFLLSFSGPALALDDGARAYWKGRAGTWVVGVQYLRFDIGASGSTVYAPGLFIFPNTDIEANIFMGMVAHHFSLFKRPSFLALTVAGGNVDGDLNTTSIPAQFSPTGATAGSAFTQSSSGITDPAIQFVVNLVGTPRLISVYDLLNYEPKFTLDVAALMAFPLGNYDRDKLINLGLNRFFGRIAIPMKYHFGPFSQGRMTSLELVPSIWLFAENSDFLQQTLNNDPMLQIESHVTHDFTKTFFASLDFLYRWGFKSRINGADIGNNLNIGSAGLTLNFQATDNLALRGSYSHDVFSNAGLSTSLIRFQLVYHWHKSTEDTKKLKKGEH